MRRLVASALLTTSIAACAPEAAGPAAPIAVEQFAPGAALEASAARQAVVAFIEAYAASPSDVGPLAELVAGDELQSWVRWLGVQHREFSGTISSDADVRDVEFIGTLVQDEAEGAQVGLSASVTFAFAPVDGEAFERARILDGPVTLMRTRTGDYRVIDLLRDGVPMSDGIQLFEGEVRTHGSAGVGLDSLFMFPPNWQFNVVVVNEGPVPLLLDEAGPVLATRTSDGFERLGGVATGSVAVVPPGATVEGIVAFPMQDSADGRVLSLSYTAGKDAMTFEFPLEDLVTAVPPPPPTAEAPAQDETT